MRDRSASSFAAPAIGVIELCSIARGLVVADAVVKRAEVELLAADPITPGKYILVFTGGVAEVEEALGSGRQEAAAEELDWLLLPHAHREIVPALRELSPPPIVGAVGVLELRTVAATLAATDLALKTADVSLVALHLARGVDGKGYVAFTGELDAVEASVEAGDAIVAPRHRAGREIIARPHPDLDWALSRLAFRSRRFL